MSRGWRITLWIVGAVVALILIAFFVLYGPPKVANSFASPEFCGNCHEMEPWLDGFRNTTHSELDSCNDCHLPHGSQIEYYYWEAIVGIRDVAEHSVGAIPDPITARDRTRDWVRTNCRRCHDDEIDEDHGEGFDYCWECHEKVFHMVEQ